MQTEHLKKPAPAVPLSQASEAEEEGPVDVGEDEGEQSEETIVHESQVARPKSNIGFSESQEDEPEDDDDEEEAQVLLLFYSSFSFVF